VRSATADASGRRAVLVAAHRWVHTARLALAARDAGFEVGLIGPTDHPLADLRWVRRVGHYSPLRPTRSIVHALNETSIDLLLPVDDLAVSGLFRAYADPRTGTDAATTIRRSLGNPDTFPFRHDRAAVINRARNAGVVVAETWPTTSWALLAEAAEKAGFPAVLKADRSFGGQGVVLVNNLRDAGQAYSRLRRPPGLRRGLARLIADDDPNYLASTISRDRPSVSVQRFIAGSAANLVAAAWDGRVLGHVGVRVLRTAGTQGPATVVEPFEHPDMSYAAAVLARELGLSGLFGLDFILECDGRSAELIEFNPRATPTAHLQPRSLERPLLELLAGRLGVSTPSSRPHRVTGAIPLFPQECGYHPENSYPADHDQDIPWHAPDVVNLCRDEPLLRVRPLWARITKAIWTPGSRLGERRGESESVRSDRADGVISTRSAQPVAGIKSPVSTARQPSSVVRMAERHSD
jgi:hypothetical protein